MLNESKHKTLMGLVLIISGTFIFASMVVMFLLLVAEQRTIDAPKQCHKLFSGKNVVIIGGTKGLGFNVAKKLLQEHNNVIIAYHSHG